MQQFLKRHNYLCPEASLLFLDCQDIPVEKITEFKGLDVTNFSKVKQIMKINNFQGASFYVVCPGVIVVDLGKNGDILSNIRGAMRFIDRHNAQIKRMLHNLMEPKYLDCEGEMI